MYFLLVWFEHVVRNQSIDCLLFMYERYLLLVYQTSRDVRKQHAIEGIYLVCVAGAKRVGGGGGGKARKGKRISPIPSLFLFPRIPHPFRRPLGPTLLSIHSFLNFFFFQYPFAECRFVQMHKLRKNVNVIFQSQYILKII